MATPKVVEVPVGISGHTLVISGHPASNGFPPLYLFRVKRSEEEQAIHPFSQEQAETFYEALGGALAHVGAIAERQPLGQGRLL